MTLNKKSFFDVDKLSSILMLFSTMLALFFTNSSLSNYYNFFIKYSFFETNFSFKDFINDILMAIFFLDVVLELKKEFCEGVLAKFRSILLPLIAALGGMLIPALIYIIINWNLPNNLLGFAIPCATDIAFAIAIFNMVAKYFPPTIKTFLLSIAIFDDLGAILLIAILYNKSISLIGIVLLLLTILILYVLNQKKVKSIFPYILCGIFLWFFLCKIGIHTTMAGVILGLFIPSKVDTYSPLKCLLKIIHPWVVILILPLFTFTASGINFSQLNFLDLFNPLVSGIFLGLFLGKQLGIFLFSFLLIKMKLSHLPKNSNWYDIYVVSTLGGIGFTMSLFIGELAFSDQKIQYLVKTGLISGSLFSAAWGVVVSYVIYIFRKKFCNIQ